MNRCLILCYCLLVLLCGCGPVMPVAADPFPLKWTSDGKFCQVDDLSQCRNMDKAKADIEERNQLQHELLGTATQLCTKFKKELSKRTNISTYTGIVSQALSTGSSVVRPELASKKVAAGGTVMNYVTDSFEKRFAEQRLSIALSGIEYARTNIFKKILENSEESLTKYPVSRAVNDALRYHDVCSLQAGLDASSRIVADQIAAQ